MALSIRVAGWAIAALVLVQAAAAQTVTVDEVVAKHLAARGGVEKLRGINTVKITGVVTAQGMELPMTTWAKRPNLMRRDTKFQDQNIVVAFDGTTVWGINPMTGSSLPQKVAGPQADLTKEEAAFDPLLMSYKERGHVVELVGTETINGGATHHLKVTKKSGSVEQHYISVDSGLEVRAVATLEQGGMKAEVTTDFADYQSVEGIQVPFSVKQSMNGNPVLEVKLQKVEFNLPIEDEFFRMPKAEAPSL